MEICHIEIFRGGLAVKNEEGFIRFIHSIENAQFRSKFEQDIRLMKGDTGIGVISDYEDQPLIIRSHLGTYAIVTVRAIKELEGERSPDLEKYSAADSQQYRAMVERIRQRLRLVTLKYQRLEDLVKAIGLSKEKLCTYCWDGTE